MTSTLASKKQPESIDTMVSVLEELRSVTDALGRTDLSARLAMARQRVTDNRLRIVVTGESRKGISSVVNALVSADVCATNVTHSMPVVVQYGETPSTATVKNPRTGRPQRVVATAPADLLAEGVLLLDAPGVTGADSRRAASILSSLSTADAVLFVSDASQEYTAPEIRYLEQVHQLCPQVVCVINKIDSYGQWADIQKANRKHLNNAELGLPILPVSAAMHQTAHRIGDKDLEIESGIPQLVEFLRANVVGRADILARDSVINDVRVVTDHIALALNAELATLHDPAHSEMLLDRIRHARDAADNLRKQSANWQYALGDGITELTVAVEHDLRNRLRALVREAEEEIGKSDPAARWDAFGKNLDNRITDAVSQNFVLAHRLSLELANKVGCKFTEEGQLALPTLPGASTDGVTDQLGSLESLDSSKTGLVQRIITSLRGSYGGVLMIGLATNLLHMSLINPWSIGAGVLLGINTFREDHKSLKQRRQAEAKMAVARLMDEVIFQVNKESKQRLREVQRTLRDHFTEVADEMLRSVNESLAAAQQANNLHEGERNSRMESIQATLAQLRDLRVRAAGLVTATTGVAA